MATSTIHFPAYPRRVLLGHDSQFNKHIVWTQEFSNSERTWSTPQSHDDASRAILSNPRLRGTPSESITKWAFSHPIINHFTFVTHLTVSNYDNFAMEDILKMLGSVPRLEELELCRVNILDTGRSGDTGPFARPTHMATSLKRLAIEACNITEGYPDAYYNLLFRFLALFDRIERLRLVATIFRGEEVYFAPSLYYLELPTLVHLEVEGFFSCVLLAFFEAKYPVQELLSLHLSRCLSSWGKLFRLKRIVEIVRPTLQHFAFRPNLEADTESGLFELSALFRDFAQAVAQCTELRELELGLYTATDDRDRGHAMSLFQQILQALPPARLHHLAFVLDLGDARVSAGDSDVVPWASLDAQMDRVCSAAHASPLQIRIERPRGARNMPAGFYADPGRRFWVRLLPEMWTRMRKVVDGVRKERLAVGQYAAPMGIDVLRLARLAKPGLRSLFDQ